MSDPCVVFGGAREASRRALWIGLEMFEMHRTITRQIL